jgi:hypothetical protein
LLNSLAANHWNVYCAGTADNYMAGRLGINQTTIDADVDIVSSSASQNPLQITGAASQTAHFVQLYDNSLDDVVHFGTTRSYFRDPVEVGSPVVAQDATTKQYTSETFITENLLQEAGTEDGRHFGSYKIGEDDNNTEFEPDGTIKFNGDAVVWDDLRFPVGSVRLVGAFPPTETPYKGGIVIAFDSGPNDESIQFNAQLPHSWKEGGEVHFHLHWLIPVAGAGGGAENVKWDFTYSWANIDAAFPVESSATVTVDVQNLAADTHTLTEVVELDATGKTLSSMLICSLTRDVGVANDYANDAYFLEADFHYEIDTMGSRQELIK